MEDQIKFTEANRKAWNVAMGYHREAMDKEWDQIFSDPNGVVQTEHELGYLKKLGIEGRNIVHLCCNNGIELMSLKRLGAKRVVGFDISDEAIIDAKKRSEKFEVEAEFYQSDVYKIPEEFLGKFDLVYITIGALTWLPDINKFFSTVSSLLKKEGNFFIYEQHPFTEMLPWDISEHNQTPVIENSYFQDEVTVHNGSLDYYGGVDYESPETYEFAHTMSDILISIIENNLKIKLFKEFEEDISNGLHWVKKTGLRLPLSFLIIGEKY